MTDCASVWVRLPWRSLERPRARRCPGTVSRSCRSTICWELHEYARNILEGNLHDDTFFAYIACADAESDPFDPITWAMASVLAGSDIGHRVKSILPYECPWAERLEEPPIFAWEGPDGSRILVRWRDKDYVEGRFVLRHLRATNTAIRDQVIPRYEGLDEAYPFDAIALVGCYGDLAPNSRDLPAKKAATIAAYNAQGWDYPRLVNASHRQFWDDIDAQIDPVHGAHGATLTEATEKPARRLEVDQSLLGFDQHLRFVETDLIASQRLRRQTQVRLERRDLRPAATGRQPG